MFTTHEIFGNFISLDCAAWWYCLSYNDPTKCRAYGMGAEWQLGQTFKRLKQLLVQKFTLKPPRFHGVHFWHFIGTFFVTLHLHPSISDTILERVPNSKVHDDDGQWLWKYPQIMLYPWKYNPIIMNNRMKQLNGVF